jgi:hypothetical protein
LRDLDKFLDIMNQRPKRGRPPETRKFEEFDRDIIGFLNLRIIQPPRRVDRYGYWPRVRVVSVMATIRELVTECWNQLPYNERRRKIGGTVNAAVLRIFKQLPAAAHAFPAVTRRKRAWHRQ